MSLAWETFGRGPDPVVALHGLGRSRQDWRDVAARLDSRFQLFAVDLPGHGESSAEWSAFADVLELLEELPVSRPASIIGHSLGGMLAALAGARGGWACAVDLDGQPTPDLSIADRTALDRARSAVLDQLPPDFRPTRSTFERVLSQVGELDLRPALRATGCPTLVLTATRLTAEAQSMQDMAIRVRERTDAALEEVAAANPLVQLAALEVTHDLLLEAPDQVAELLNRVLP